MAETVDLVVLGGTLVTEQGELPDTSIAIHEGRFVALGGAHVMPPSRRVIDAGGRHLLPGVIDGHVHFREPGMAYKEGYLAGSGAAALGGVTCVFDMPNTEPPTNTAERLADKLALVQGRSWVDYGLYGLLGPGDAAHLESLAAAGVVGFKAFVGQSETGAGCPLPPCDGELYEAMETLSRLGIRLAVHAENDSFMRWRMAGLRRAGRSDLEAHRQSRPPVVEAEAIQRVGLFARYTGCAVHVVHVSSAAGVEAVRAVRREGTGMTAETCPHYLVPPGEGDSAELRVNPPIRSEPDGRALIRAVATGDLQMVASDHAPHAASEKTGSDVWQVRAGLIGTQHLLPLLLDRRGELGLSLSDVVRLTSFEPARIWGVWPRKGAVLPGSDADLTIVDLDRSWRISPGTVHSRHRLSPYRGWTGRGAPVTTVVRGTVVAQDGSLTGQPPGRWVPGRGYEPSRRGADHAQHCR
jgi:dihydroorotase